MRGLEPVHSQLGGMHESYSSNLIKFRMTWKPKLLVHSRIFPPYYVEIFALLKSDDLLDCCWALTFEHRTKTEKPLSTQEKNTEKMQSFFDEHSPQTPINSDTMAISIFTIIYIYIHCRSNQHIQ